MYKPVVFLRKNCYEILYRLSSVVTSNDEGVMTEGVITYEGVTTISSPQCLPCNQSDSIYQGLSVFVLEEKGESITIKKVS